MASVGLLQHKRPPTQIAAIGVALIALWTGLVVAYSTLRTETWREENALKIGRQIATQAEGLLLSARLRGEKDPLGWTILQMSQGVEPRVIRVSRADPEVLGSRLEFWGFAEKGDELEYLKRIGTDEKAGVVRVSILAPPLGFLGAFSRPMSDLLVLLFFAGHLTVAYLAWKTRFQIREVEHEVIREVIREVPAEPAPEKPKAAIGISTESLKVWSAEATANLRDLGQSLRGLLNVTRDVSLTSAAARESVVTLNRRLHDSLRGVAVDQKESRALISASIKAEALAMNVVLGALRLSQGGQVADVLEARERIRRDAEVLVTAIQAMREKAEGRAQSSVALRELLEPCTVESDLALRSFDPLADLIQALDEPTRSSSERLIQQARLLRGTPGPESLPAHDIGDGAANL
jgi:hypothetical protein